MGVAASSSSSVPCKKHEVFLSFRGEDTRRSFTSHLHTALTLKGIETYIDYELPKGDDISQSLIEAIQNSYISVVIFSENYASSKWCLNELIHILHCKQHDKQHVIPVFYQVDPSHVRNQRGAYEEAFAEHMKKTPEKVDEWRKALFQTASLAGWHSANCRDEAELIRNIVNDIIKKLNHGPTSLLTNIVGIDENCDNIEFYLERFSTIGIWGMGGIGKTTMAKVVFAKYRSQFDSCCFLENFREQIEKHGLTYVCDKLIYELSKDTSLGRLSHRKVLVVLDDVSNTSQLDCLESEAPPLGPGSKVIITSRDKHVLDGRVEKIHEAKGLCYHNSLELFTLKAFHKDGYESEYEELVDRAVAYAHGSPLALTVLGSFLHSKTVDEWEDALKKLERTIHQDIQAVLKLSYDGLDDEEKEIFLDIACFFKCESKGYVISTLESCGFHASIGLRTLVDKAMVNIGVRGEVWMHDLIQSMAFEIVHQESKNPAGRSRLWDPNEISNVLESNQGTEAIQGISLDLSQIEDIQLSVNVFRKMTNLRFLKLFSPRDKRSYTVNPPSRLEPFSNSLRYLWWENYHSKTLSLPFCAEKLVELHMPNSNLKKLWDGVQNLVNLKNVSFKGSIQLMELPDFSMAQNLLEVDLSRCESLSHLHPSLLSLPKLSKLTLRYCKSLMSVKTESQSKSISHLNVFRCSSLKEFSFSSDKITDLYLEYTGVQILDFSMGCMKKLQKLSLNCSTIKNLPINDICCMRSLQALYLYECGALIDQSKLHALFDSLQCLKSITLEKACNLTELPNNIKNLSRLTYLQIYDCKKLQSLPELPPSMKSLNAHNCTSLKTLQLTCHIQNSLLADDLLELTLTDFHPLYKLPKSTGSLSSLDKLDLSGSNVESLPDSIKHLSKLCFIYLTNCRRLRSLPELPPFIHTVDASGCISLKIVPTLIASISKLRSLFLEDCLELEDGSLSHVMEWAYLSMKASVYIGEKVNVCYPGRQIPEWFTFKHGTSYYTNIELPPPTSNLIGFIFCSVVSHRPRGSLSCQIHYNGKMHQCSRFLKLSNTRNHKDLDSHHVFIWCDSATFLYSIQSEEGQNKNFSSKLSFEFSFVQEHRGIVHGVIETSMKEVGGIIEACGVYPIYASEYVNFIQHMELESNMALGTQKISCLNSTENSFHGMLNYARFSINQGKGCTFEGTSIPEWFIYKNSKIGYRGLELSAQLATEFDSLIGFIFCFVIPHFPSKEMDQYYSSCECGVPEKSNDGPLKCYSFYLNGPEGWHYSMQKMNSDDIFMWYDPLYCKHLLQKLPRYEKGCDKELEFMFDFGEGYFSKGSREIGDCLIKECGVRPIYASEFTSYLQQNN